MFARHLVEEISPQIRLFVNLLQNITAFSLTLLREPFFDS